MTIQPTSLEALNSIQPDLSALQSRVLHAIRTAGRPVTDEDLMRLTGLSPNTLRPRRVELMAKGLVVDSGTKGRTSTGRRAIAWAVKR